MAGGRGGGVEGGGAITAKITVNVLEFRMYRISAHLEPLSLRTADVFPIVASLPPKNLAGREATTGNRSAVHKLETAITPLQRGGFPAFATTSKRFIDIIHSTESKAIKEGLTSVNSNYKSSHVASNFVLICIMLIRKVCTMKS